jgi:DTW domain-containing protein YfiP
VGTLSGLSISKEVELTKKKKKNRCDRCVELSRIDLCNLFGDHVVFASSVNMVLNHENEWASVPNTDEKKLKRIKESLEVLNECIDERERKYN